jgi:hypothetical protein
MSQHWKVHTLLGALILTAACAKPPTQEMADAESALNAATQAGAEQYAAAELTAAQETLADARAKMESQDYKGAKLASLDAKVKAEAALAAVEPNKQAAMAGAQERMDALKPQVEAAVADAGKVKGKTAQALKDEAAALSSLWAAVDGDFAAGNYAAVNARLDEAQAKLDQLKAAVEQAKAPAKKR